MRVRPTRGGLYFGALLLIVTFAAYNTSNNLIFLMLSVGVASVPAAAAAGFLALRGLSLDWTASGDAYAGTPFKETLGLASRSRLFDAFGVRVDGRTKVPVVGRSGEQVRTERLYPRRGAHLGEPVVLESTFPLGLFSVSRVIARVRAILVFPALRPVDGTMLARDARGHGSGSATSGGGDEFHGLREYVRGDHVHHIHWKTSARAGELMVRQLGQGRDERVLLAFDRGAPGSDEGFELLVTATASLASYLVTQGTTFAFASDEIELRPDSGRAHLRRVLTYLATVARASSTQTEPPRRTAEWRARLEQRTRAGFRVLAFVEPGGSWGGSASRVHGVVTLDPERVLVRA